MIDDNVADPSVGSDKDFLEYIIKSIVGDPSKVFVTRTIDDKGILLTLQVDREDMGKVIGKGGQTAKSVRILLRVIGAKTNARVTMKIVEPDGEPTRFSSEDIDPSMNSNEMNVVDTPASTDTDGMSAMDAPDSTDTDGMGMVDDSDELPS